MFRFTIRDVLWLMVVAGVACGWWTERREVSRLKADMMLLIRQIDWTPAGAFRRINEKPTTNTSPPPPN
jgi:hypothetical protein